MKCLRCEAEMKQYKFYPNWNIYGKEHKKNEFTAVCQEPHNPKSIYVCDSCGYMELSTKECEQPDI